MGDIAPKVISEADKRVDTVVSTVDKYVSKDNIEAFKKTRQESLKQVEEILSKLSGGSITTSSKLQSKQNNKNKSHSFLFISFFLLYKKKSFSIPFTPSSQGDRSSTAQV